MTCRLVIRQRTYPTRRKIFLTSRSNLNVRQIALKMRARRKEYSQLQTELFKIFLAQSQVKICTLE